MSVFAHRIDHEIEFVGGNVGAAGNGETGQGNGDHRRHQIADLGHQTRHPNTRAIFRLSRFKLNGS